MYYNSKKHCFFRQNKWKTGKSDRTCDYTVYNEIAYRVSDFGLLWLRSDEKPLISAIDIEGDLSAAILAKRSFFRMNK